MLGTHTFIAISIKTTCQWFKGRVSSGLILFESAPPWLSSGKHGPGTTQQVDESRLDILGLGILKPLFAPPGGSSF